MKFNSRILPVLLFVLASLLPATHSKSNLQNQRPITCEGEKGCKASVSPNPLTNEQETLNRIELLFKESPKKDLAEGLREMKALKEQYLERIQEKERKQKQGEEPPQFSERNRLLASSYNQYPEIDQSSYLQATSNDYIFELRGTNLTIYTVSDPKLTVVYFKKFSISEYPVSIHSSADGYFAIVLQNYENTASYMTIIKTYYIQNSQVTQLRQYKKDGYFSNSRQYRSELIVLVQKAMTTPSINYTWWVSDVGIVPDNVFQGLSGNQSSNYTGYAARSLARIPLGPLTNKRFRFATYLFCDYSWDLLLSPALNIFIASNYYSYNSTSGYTYNVSFQTFALEDQPTIQWGSSRWVIFPGIFNHVYQLHEYNGYFRAVILQSYGAWNTPAYISVVKVPMSSFDPKKGQMYNNLGYQDLYFISSTWKRDLAFLIFQNGTIRTFSSSLGKVTGEITPGPLAYMLFPYGSYHMVGVGMSSNYQQFAIIMFQLTSYSLNYKQSLISNTSRNGEYPGYSSSFLGWYGATDMQFDWLNKRITFPVFSSEPEPYKSGYFHIYANPQQNCMSTLPVPNPCPSDTEVYSTVFGHLIKHWDSRPGNDYNTGYSEAIYLSTTLHLLGKQILITTSYCQIQSRVLKDKSLAFTNSSTEVWYEDLCSY